jgi:hypothetical protein
MYGLKPVPFKEPVLTRTLKGRREDDRGKDTASAAR